MSPHMFNVSISEALMDNTTDLEQARPRWTPVSLALPPALLARLDEVAARELLTRSAWTTY